LIYSGQVKLTDAVENSNRRWTISFRNENLCTDYQENLDKYDAMAIHGMVHCSGGAQTKFFIS
jgi:phosphoribosylformylglycinamidine cyclo-ligase